MKEIDSLKNKMKEQSNTFEGQQAQMKQLQEKLTELQAKQAFLRRNEPPPAYDRKSIQYNKLFPENTTSKTCCIL